MPVKQKPDPKVVKKSAKELGKSQSVKVKSVEKEEDGRILADQKNAPQPHKPPKKPSSTKTSPKKGK